MLPHLLRHAITKIVFDYTFCSRASLCLEFGAKACKVCVSHPVRGLLAPAQSQPLLHAQYCLLSTQLSCFVPTLPSSHGAEEFKSRRARNS